MSISRALGALPLAALLLAAAPDTAPAVHIKNFSFIPQTITVRAGQRVTFTNDDDEPHTVTALDKSFDSEGLDTHRSWQHAFAKPGTYAYFCEMHPYMKGRVVVLAADAGTR